MHVAHWAATALLFTFFATETQCLQVEAAVATDRKKANRPEPKTKPMNPAVKKAIMK